MAAMKNIQQSPVPRAIPANGIGILVGHGKAPAYKFTPSRDSEESACLVYRAGLLTQSAGGKAAWEEWGWLTPATWKAAARTATGLQRRDCSKARIFIGHPGFNGYHDNLFDVVSDPTGQFQLSVHQIEELLKKRADQFEKLSSARREESKGSGSIHTTSGHVARPDDVFPLFTHRGVEEDRVSLEFACEAMRWRSNSQADADRHRQWLVAEGILFQKRLARLYHHDHKRLLRAMTNASIIEQGAGGGLSCPDNPSLIQALIGGSQEDQKARVSSDAVAWLNHTQKANTTARLAADNQSFFFTVPFERALTYVKARSCWLFRGTAIVAARDAMAELLKAFRSNLTLKSERWPDVWMDAQSAESRKEVRRLLGLFGRFRRAFSPRTQDEASLSVAGTVADPVYLVANSADCIKQMWAKAVSYNGLGNDGRWRLFQTLSRAVNPSVRPSLTDAITRQLKPMYIARYMAERRPSDWNGIVFEIKKGVQRTAGAVKDGKQTDGPLKLSCTRMIADGLCPFAASGPAETATQRCADAVGLPGRVSEPLEVTAFNINSAKKDATTAKASSKRKHVEISVGGK